MTVRNLSLTAVFFIFAAAMSAQEVKHSFGGWLGGGYGSFMHSIDYRDGYGSAAAIPNYSLQPYNSSVPGGLGGMLGLGYELNVGRFLLQTGAEFAFVSSGTKFDNLYFERIWEYSDPNTISNMYYKYNFTKDYTDRQQAGFVQIPLLAGAKFGRYYGLIGAKYGINLFGKYKTAGTYSTAMKDEELTDDIEGIQNHYIMDAVNIKNGKGTSGSLKFDPNIILSAEFGVTLDEWLFPQPRRRRTSTRPIPVPLHPSIRVALFADYGLSNLIKSTEKNTELIEYYTNTDGKVETPLDLKTGQLFTTQNAAGKSVHSIMAGIKLSIFMPVKQPVKRQPRTRPRRSAPRRPQRRQPEQPVFHARVTDAETHQPLAANYQIIDTNTNKEVFGGTTDSINGLITNPLNHGNYTFLVNKDGYIYYTGSITNISKDTVAVALQPVKKELKVVLEDLFFDIDKWTIKPEAEITLEDLSGFLIDNPDIRIHITGHTDSTGTGQHNMRLSENRAKAVVEWLVKAGIDGTRLTSEGKGQNEPVDTNDTEEGRAKNRRVEFVIQ